MCMLVHMCMCVYVYIYIYIYTYKSPPGNVGVCAGCLEDACANGWGRRTRLLI